MNEESLKRLALENAWFDSACSIGFHVVKRDENGNLTICHVDGKECCEVEFDFTPLF